MNDESFFAYPERGFPLFNKRKVRYVPITKISGWRVCDERPLPMSLSEKSGPGGARGGQTTGDGAPAELGMCRS